MAVDPQDTLSPMPPTAQRAKVYYFLFGASNATITPFLNLLLQRAGLTASHIGVIGALSPWLSAPTDYALSAMADRYSLHRALFLVASILSVLCRAVVAAPNILLPPLYLFWGLLAAVVVSGMMYNITVVLVDAAVVASLSNSRSYGRVRTWASLGWGISATLIGWVIDKYGFSASWCLNWTGCALALLVGAYVVPFQLLSTENVYDNEGEGREEEEEVEGDEAREPLLRNYSEVQGVKLSNRVHTADEVIEPVLTSLHEESRGLKLQLPIPVDVHDCVIARIDSLENLAARLPPEEDDELQAENSTTSTHLSSGERTLAQIACSPRVVIFLLLVFAWGAGFGVIETYLFLWLQELHASQKLMGLTLTFTCLAEVPIMFFSDKIILALGTEGCIHLVMLALVLRLLAHSSLALWPTTWLVLPVELLHGVTFGLAWACGTVKAARLAPEGERAGMQGVFQATYMGIGKGGGTLAAGLVYDRFGAAIMFRMAAACVAAFWAITTLLKLMPRRRV